jgi:alcohol dehydrogenase
MRFPNLVLFGSGTIQTLREEVEKLGVQRALIITDPGIRRAGLVQVAQDVLSPSGIELGIFDGVQPEPPTDNVIAAAGVAHDGDFDALIGVGGGSVLDTAKAAAVLAVSGRGFNCLRGDGHVSSPPLTKILVATTAGSGSEISDSCNFVDWSAGGLKRIFSGRHLLADLAIVDPDLTRNLPPGITAESGLDALVHAIEAFTTRKANAFSDLWSRETITLAARSLRAAYSYGSHAPQAREDMALAALMGNAAADLAGLGAVHGLTHPLSTKAQIGHGLANAILLPGVMEFNLPAHYERFGQIAEILGEGGAGLSPVELAERAVRGIRRLCADLGLNNSLRTYGISEADVPGLVEIAFEHFPRHLEANPRPVSRDDAVAIYRRAL